MNQLLTEASKLPGSSEVIVPKTISHADICRREVGVLLLPDLVRIMYLVVVPE